MPRRLIVNADDFGLSPGVNRGIVAAHLHGIVTSASLMVRWPAAEEAVALAAAAPRLGLGLHVDLGEWIYRDGEWRDLYEVVALDDPTVVDREVRSQLARFRGLVGRDPTHLDSHQHVHRGEPVQSVLRRLAGEIDVPLRHFSPTIRYCGDFYGQSSRGEPREEAIRACALLAILANLPEGTTELACHPGDGERLDTMYWRERALEVESLRDPSVRAAIGELGIELCDFASEARDARCA